jgi:hypothetical protein
MHSILHLASAAAAAAAAAACMYLPFLPFPTRSTPALRRCQRTRVSASWASCLTCASVCQPHLIVDVWACSLLQTIDECMHSPSAHPYTQFTWRLPLPPACFLQTTLPIQFQQAVLQRSPLISRRALAHRGRAV